MTGREVVLAAAVVPVWSCARWGAPCRRTRRVEPRAPLGRREVRGRRPSAPMPVVGRPRQRVAQRARSPWARCLWAQERAAAVAPSAGGWRRGVGDDFVACQTRGGAVRIDGLPEGFPCASRQRRGSVAVVLSVGRRHGRLVARRRRTRLSLARVRVPCRQGDRRPMGRARNRANENGVLRRVGPRRSAVVGRPCGRVVCATSRQRGRKRGALSDGANGKNACLF